MFTIMPISVHWDCEVVMLKKVDKGQSFIPSARFHNKVADAVNRMNGFLGGDFTKGQSNEIRINFINTFSEEIPSGAPVVVDGYDEVNNIYSVRKYKHGDILIGCVKSSVESHAIGTAVFFGIVKVKAQGTINSCIVPVSNTWNWQYSDFGYPLLCATTDGVMVVVGANAFNSYKRPFFAVYDPVAKMINISGGWVLANDEHKIMPGDNIGVQNGYICVKAEFPDNAVEFSAPFFVYDTPGAACQPIAEVIVENDYVSIVNYNVSTAVLMKSIEHPPCDCMR